MINKYKSFHKFLILGLISIIPLSSLLNPQLMGEDEVLTFLVNIEILESLKNLSPKDFFINLIKDFHPPGRNLFSIPSIIIFGENITALRLPYYILWIVTCYFSLKIINKLNGNKDSLIFNIFLIAGTGLFHIQIMGFGHGMTTFLGIFLIYKLIIFTEKKQDFIPHKLFNQITILCFVGFLFFNTFILLTFNLFLIQLFLILKNNKKEFITFFLISFLHFFLYFFYYCIFLGLPYLLVNESQTILPIIENIFGKLNFGNWDQKTFGQYHQYTVRQNSLAFNYSSLLANIKYLNWHFLPYASYFVIIFSILYLLKKQIIVFLFIITYFLFVNFLMVGNTGQHFVSLFIWLIPFFSLYVSSKVNFSNYTYILKFFYFFIILFTFSCHIYIYNEKNYPHKITSIVNGNLKWPPNLKRPLKQISNDVKSHNINNELIHYTVDGAVIHYFLKGYKSYKIDLNGINRNGKKINCKKLKDDIKFLIVSELLDENCNKFFVKTINYKNSNLKLLIR